MSDRKPQVTLPSGATGYTDTATELFSAATNMYYRGGRVVEFIKGEASIMRPDMLQSRCERFCDLFSWRRVRGENELQRSKMSGDVAKVLLSSMEAQEILPNVEKISNCPVIVPDEGNKTRILGAGHHEGHNVFVTSNEDIVDVPLDEAVQALKGLIEEFQFTTEGDYARAISTMILPAFHAGGWFDGKNIPIEIAEADKSQSGKTYRQACSALIYNGRIDPVIVRKGGVGSFDECLSVAMVKGHQFIQIDNVRDKIDSPLLESVLTAQNNVDLRVPVHGHISACPRNHIFYLTSNGAKTTQDLTNRALIVRITKKEDDFEFKDYEEGDLGEHIEANQPYYLGCVFSVITAWSNAGRQRTKARGHSFKYVIRTIDWIVQNIFCCSPLLEGHDLASKRMHTPGLSFFRALSIAIKEDGCLGVDYIAMEIAEIAIQHEISVPGTPQHAVEIRVARQIGMIRKRVFKGDENSTMTVSVDNLYVSCFKKSVYADGKWDSDRWVYRFDDEETLKMENNSAESTEKSEPESEVLELFNA